MKVSDYVVEFFINKGVTDVFGYPGGMVTHIMESFDKYSENIATHLNYHEQACAFAACGYAQTSDKIGVAYATSGPGATNLVTGICNAFYDSIPTFFITGQVNSNESKGQMLVRQRGFQETDIISMVDRVTNYCHYVEDPEQIKYYLEKAFYYATNGRKGPVLLDIPMNVQRMDVDVDKLSGFTEETNEIKDYSDSIDVIVQHLENCKRPSIVLGNAVKECRDSNKLKNIIKNLHIPVVTSLPAIDFFTSDSEYNYGFIGAYGNRAANFVVAKSDLIISLGSRLDIRQVGARRENFAKDATIIRIDIDSGELSYKVNENEFAICADINEIVDVLDKKINEAHITSFSPWLEVCKEIKQKLAGIDDEIQNKIISKISDCVDDDVIITNDVGQNQIWVAQSFRIREEQKVLFSAGFGAMGYSLPAAIGAYYGTKKRIICFNGDGGIQMNLQELQFLARERIPVVVIVLNNYALGMMRHFQEMYFNSNYVQTVEDSGYKVPLFKKLADAFSLDYYEITGVNDVKAEMFTGENPTIVEVKLQGNTYIKPKLEFGKPNQDQEPLINRELFDYLMQL